MRDSRPSTREARPLLARKPLPVRVLRRAAQKVTGPLVRLLAERRIRRLVLERWDGLGILVLPEVFNPVVFRAGVYLAQVLGAIPLPATDGPSGSRRPRALDMGTGSGVGALALARSGFDVVAVDVNPAAVRCARINALLNGLEQAIDVREGDLFGPVGDETFDVISFGPPFFDGTPTDLHDRAWRGQRVFERFAAELPRHLAPGGVALSLLSDLGPEERQRSALLEAGLEVSVHAWRSYLVETFTIWAARHPAKP